MLFAMLLDIQKLLDIKLEKGIADEEKRTEIFRQVIEVIEERIVNFLKVGTFVYVKSSVTAPEGKPQLADRDSLDYYTYKYKIYHPAFPHEPTSDQFFDKVQWESYFKLGQYIGAEVLGDDELLSFSSKSKKAFSIEDLLVHFDQNSSLFEELPEPKVEQVEEKMVSREIPSEKAVAATEEVTIEPSAEAEIAAPEEPEPSPETKDEKVVLGEEVQYKM
jgi:hypothetical protein